MSPVVHIVGAGPAGLALATHFIAQPDTAVHVYEKTNAIGGAHATHWVDGYLTQHAPVVYAKSYVNAFAWLRGLGVDTNTFFRPYAFGTNGMVVAALRHFSLSDTVKLGAAWLRAPGDGSVAELTKRLGLSPSAADYLDRLCRLLDGAGADRFAVRELFALGYADLLQPTAPMDELWAVVAGALTDRGVVFHLGAAVTGIVRGPARVWHFTHGKSERVHVAPTDTVILAAPPANFPDVFPDYEDTDYDPHVSVTLHYDVDIPTLPHGFPAGPWKIIYIQFGRGFSQRKEIRAVVSATVTNHLNVVAPDETIGLEVARQISAAARVPLPAPAKVLVYKGAIEGYVAAAGTKPFPFQIGACQNFFTVGCQNRAPNAFTSMETAVAAARAFTGTPVLAPPKTSGAAIAVVLAILIWFAVTWKSK